MVASKDIKTPMMEVPLLKASAKLEKRVEKLTRKLQRIPLEKVVAWIGWALGGEFCGDC